MTKKSTTRKRRSTAGRDSAKPTIEETEAIAKEASVLSPEQERAKKWRNWWIRSFWTFFMIFLFVGILFSGYIWLILIVIIIQIQVYRELISIAHVPSKEMNLPWFRSMSWYFLATTNYFLYGESIIYYFRKHVLVDAFLLPLATHHRFISFSLYYVGFVLFVLNLQKGHYKFQFSHFGWTHMTLLLVVVQSHFIVNNIFEGLFWFVLPASLVVCNDIMAYVFGFFFGRTPLISLSPKKTWEGFLGAFVSTLIFAFFFAGLLGQMPYMICPPDNVMTSYFSHIQCTPSSAFTPEKVMVTPFVSALLKRVLGQQIVHVLILPVQRHAVIMAMFASLIAPFGGFFASGIKRAFKIKDFGDSIPGHGGLTDRMDCQFLMGLFSHIYFQTFIGHNAPIATTALLQTIITQLSEEQQLDVYNSLHEYLVGQRLLKNSSS